MFLPAVCLRASLSPSKQHQGWYSCAQVDEGCLFVCMDAQMFDGHDFTECVRSSQLCSVTTLLVQSGRWCAPGGCLIALPSLASAVDIQAARPSPPMMSHLFLHDAIPLSMLQAVVNGAAAFIAMRPLEHGEEHPLPEGFPVLIVEKTLTELGRLAAAFCDK